jgi:RNA polymerase sigma-70 factor (ECF subfamily)
MIMSSSDSEERLALFEAHRGRLFGLAYRMLGSRADAEDVVQDAWLRWQRAGPDIRTPEAWLVTATTRLAIDRLRTAKTAREAYQGPWLPEPLVGKAAPAPDSHVEQASDLSLAFLVLLERLGPEERAAFLLHEVFDVPYPDIAETLGKTEQACRQIVSRARQRVRAGRRRAPATNEARTRLVHAFNAAMVARDEATLLQLFAPDAVWTADGGGVVHASPRPLVGAGRLVKLVLGLQRVYARHHVTLEPVEVNGEAGLLLRAGGRMAGVFAFESVDDRIAQVYVVLNPAKLGDRDVSQPGVPPVSGS